MSINTPFSEKIILGKGVFFMSENNRNFISKNLQENMDYLSQELQVDLSFDLVYRVIHVGGRKACIYSSVSHEGRKRPNQPRC